MKFILLTISSIAIIFAAIRVLRLKLYSAVSIAVVAISLLSGISMEIFWRQVQLALTSPSTHNTVLMTVFASYFGTLMLRTGHIETIFAKPQHKLSAANTIAFVPTLMGFLLSPPGGSRASCKMLVQLFEPQGEECLANLTLANIWFRLCGRFLSPFIPALTLLYGLLGIPVSHTILLVLPITALMLVVGKLFLVRNNGNLHLHTAAQPSQQAAYLLYGLLPLALTFTFAFAGLPLYCCLLLGTTAAYAEYLLRGRMHLPWRELLRMIDWRLGLTVVSVCIYNFIIEASGTLPAFIDLAAAVIHSDVVLVLVLLTVSVILGYCMGSVVGSIGVTVPIMLALGNGNALVLGAIVYVGTNIGCYMLSPLNTDYLSSQDILSANFALIYKKVFIPLCLALAGVILYGLIMLRLLAF